MADTATLQALLDHIAQWQENGADHFDPVRFRFLQRQGERLQQQRHCSAASLARLSAAVSEYQQRLDAATREAETCADRPPASPQALRHWLRQQRRPDTRSPLAALREHYSQPEADTGQPRDPLTALLHAQESDLLDDSPEPTQAHTPPRELKALTRARRGQQQQRKRQRIDLALTQTPSDAGPLNSHRLVTSAIRTLQTLSPAYLEHFVNYVETLMVLEKAGKKRS